MPGLSDKELVILTPTLEEFGLIDHPEIKERWQSALSTQEDQRTRNIAKNLKNRENAGVMEEAADKVVAKAVETATRDADVYIQFIIDISASMEGAIDLSKEALSMIVQGFPQERVHISAFNTMGYLLRPRHWSGKGIEHMLKAIQAGGGTSYSSGLAVFSANKVRIPEGADLILFCVGDEAGESGEKLRPVRGSMRLQAQRDCSHSERRKWLDSRIDGSRRGGRSRSTVCGNVGGTVHRRLPGPENAQSTAGIPALPVGGTSVASRENSTDTIADKALLITIQQQPFGAAEASVSAASNFFTVESRSGGKRERVSVESIRQSRSFRIYRHSFPDRLRQVA